MASVVIRCDGSPRIGTGHVVRCLALADFLAESGAAVTFITRNLGGDMPAMIRGAGFEVRLLDGTGDIDEATDASRTASAIATLARPDWLVVDHYSLGLAWERTMRAYATRIAVIADNDRRPHDADLLVDGNLGAQAGDYRATVPGSCALRLGPRYALLRRQFPAARLAGPRRKDGDLRVLVCFGGADPANASALGIEAVKLALRDGTRLSADIVVGVANPRRAELAAACAGVPQIRFHHAVADMAARMQAADIFVGSSGSITWECATLGLPGLVVALADNQIPLGAATAAAGADVFLGTAAQTSAREIATLLAVAARTPAWLDGLAARAATICDGGGAARIAAYMRNAGLTVRRAVAADRDALLEWRNHESVRRWTSDAAPVPPARHRQWFDAVLADPDRILLVAETAGDGGRWHPVGVLRYDIAGDEAEISVYLVPGPGGNLPAGIGSEVIAAGDRWLRAERNDIRRVAARIGAANVRSAGAFARAGYEPSSGIYTRTLEGVDPCG